MVADREDRIRDENGSKGITALECGGTNGNSALRNVVSGDLNTGGRSNQ